MTIDTDYLTTFLIGLLNTPSPTGDTPHVDTLGAMVKEIKPNGRLALTQIGGYAWNVIEGEGVTVATEGLGTYRGTVQLLPGFI